MAISLYLKHLSIARNIYIKPLNSLKANGIFSTYFSTMKVLDKTP